MKNITLRTWLAITRSLLALLICALTFVTDFQNAKELFYVLVTLTLAVLLIEKYVVPRSENDQTLSTLMGISYRSMRIWTALFIIALAFNLFLTVYYLAPGFLSFY